MSGGVLPIGGRPFLEITTTMKTTMFLYLALLTCFLPVAPFLGAQETIGPAEQQAVVDSLCRQLTENYVYPEKGEQMAARLRDQLRGGQYSEEINVHTFADQLTREVQAMSLDKHLTIRYDPEMARRLSRPHDEAGEPAGPPPDMLDRMRRENYGFREVRILAGNVGYLDLRGFYSPAEGGEAAAAAMNFLSGADAIVFDLRRNGGGDPGMIQLLTSYLYGPGANIHLNSFYFRPSDETTQTWTLPYVPGQRNPDAKVFVLTSSFTFSAAEEFTYNLKNLGRATIVGETTGGGAHPGGPHPLGERFTVFVPVGRAINPISGTNWEGTGVEPDVPTPSAEALDRAHLLALEALGKEAEAPDRKQYFAWYAEDLKARLDPPRLDAETLARFAGTYGPRRLTWEEGTLSYQREGRPRLKLRAINEHTFSPEGMPGFRLQLVLEGGRPVALMALEDNGYSERHPRDEPQRP